MAKSSLLYFEALCRVPGLAHAIVVKPCNLAPHTGPQRDLALVRRRQVCAELRLDSDRFTCPQQVHGTNVAMVEARNAGSGRDSRDTAIPDCDGVMTDLQGVPLAAFGADCCLLLIVEPGVRAIGLTHAGWRGVAEGGARVLVERMREVYSARPERMLAAVGPAARSCCYEISKDLARQLAAGPHCGPDVVSCRQGKWFLDMQTCLVRQMLACGLVAAHIEQCEACTICDPRFFSYRREGAETGRNAILAGWTT